MKKGRSVAMKCVAGRYSASRYLHYGASALLVQLAVACSPTTPQQNAVAEAVDARAARPTPDAGVPADSRLVVAFGDSLYAGYNLAQDEGFAPALERALQKRDVPSRVINAGVSGDTSAAGLARLAFTLDGLPRTPDLVIVGFGGNDMLRGLSPDTTRANIDAMLTALERRGIPAMLTGMLAAPNMGVEYGAAFNAIYPALAKTHGVPLYPFFLDGVLGQRDLLLPDGIHPNAQGVTHVVERIAPIVAKDLDN